MNRYSRSSLDKQTLYDIPVHNFHILLFFLLLLLFFPLVAILQPKNTSDDHQRKILRKAVIVCIFFCVFNVDRDAKVASLHQDDQNEQFD